jgi:hypothetical protein
MSTTARVPHRRTSHPTGAIRVAQPRANRSVPSRPELRLVTGPLPSRTRPPRAAASHRAPFVLLVLALLIGTTVALLVLNTAIAVDSLQASALRRENTKRVEEVQRLQRQVITGTTPEKIAAAAASAGLVPAGTPGHLVVEPDGSSTLRGTPTPAKDAPLPAAPSAGAAAPAAPSSGTAATPATPATPPAPASEAAGD